MESQRARLERLQLVRQASLWAPVLWFPPLVYALATARFDLVVLLGVAGAVFAALCRFLVWQARCPGCAARFGATSEGFRGAWNETACVRCGLSLFALRRDERRSR